MNQLRLASLTSALPSGDTPAAPNAIQLLPAGRFRAEDGRPTDVPAWQIDADIAAALITQAASKRTPFVIDYEHQTLLSEQNGQPAPAAGWFENLQWRDGSGLWAVDVHWTARARQMIQDGEYRFISPVFSYDKQGRVRKLHHAALTNHPALDGMAAVAARALNPSPTETSAMNEILALLGLSADADEAQAAQAIQALLDKLQQAEQGMADLKASHQPNDVVAALKGELATLSAQLRSREIEELITPALADGRLLPVQEAWARELGQNNLNALKTYLATTPAVAALKGTQTDGKAPDNAPAALSSEEREACRLLGMSESDYTTFKARG